MPAYPTLTAEFTGRPLRMPGTCAWPALVADNRLTREARVVAQGGDEDQGIHEVPRSRPAADGRDGMAAGAHVPAADGRDDLDHETASGWRFGPIPGGLLGLVGFMAKF